MEITPRRSLSLNLEITNKNFGISPPIREMWTAQSMKTMETPPSGYRMSHSLSMDDARVNPTLQKKDNTILRSMIGIFGSLGSMVSKIPSFMSSINNPLSVTVVSNEGIISPEYILKNLTTSGDHEAPEPLKLFDEIQESSPYNSKSNIAEILAERVGGKGFLDVNNLAKSWIEGLQDAQESINSFNESNDLNLAIQESLKIKSQNNYLQDTTPEIIDELETNSDTKRNKIEEELARMEEGKSLKTKSQNNYLEATTPETIDKLDINSDMKRTKIEEELVRMEEEKTEAKIDDKNCGMEGSAGVSFSAVDDTLDRMDCGIPSKRPHLQKTRRKPNTIARSRGKARGKYQLRKSGVSQSKHRKERTKQNLYSNIQDDLSAWEEMEDDSSEEVHCRIPIVDGECRDADAYHIPEYPMFIETFVLGESGRTQRGRKVRGPDRGKLSYRVRFRPDCKEDVLSPITHDFRQRLLSESSIDSEDSCCIVFEDESEYQSEDGCGSEEYDFGDSSDEDEEKEEEERAEQKVRFNLEPTVHTMIQWNYAYRAARRGPWEQMARDRDRFRVRINCIGRVLDPILTVKHRECIWHDRFSVDESIQK
ncbi:uncharacterized protein LOC107040293 [Diachasma alloeum]|uniref:uncharacterized protein LOC107040293 n=1 Tax=Diachasma alloeum TaxID=454923 RepID=UPI0007384912|nr:uncharacterized protein LOC107040293 [Diachasma alloeum]